MEDYPLELKEEYVKLSGWMRELSQRYKNRILIKVIDAQSILGVYKSLRHRVRKYPAFIVEGKETYTGWDKNRLESLLVKHTKKSLSSAN